MLGQALRLDDNADARLDAPVPLRLGLGRRELLCSGLRRIRRRQAGAGVRQQGFLIALQADAVVAALV